jgi:polyphenol oxidase
MDKEPTLFHLTADWPERPRNVGVLCTTRRGGVSRKPYDDGQGGGGLNLSLQVEDDPADVERNRDIVAAHLPSPPRWLLHSDGAAVADLDSPAPPGPQWADACVTRTPGTVCAVLTADALPILLSSADGQVVGAVRAGWRSLAAGIVQHTVAAMRAGRDIELRAWLGAAIGFNQFLVGDDVRKALLDSAVADARLVDTAFLPSTREGKHVANLYALARLALERCGVASVSGGLLCTVSNSARFYSYRRDGKTGRQASLIWIR